MLTNQWKKSMKMVHTSHLITATMMLTEDTGCAHQKLVHQERGIGMTLMIGEAGMRVISTDQMVTIVINLHRPKGWQPSYF